ncbi:transcription factor IBH1-like [Quercus lobata]|uniref:transcription factor IBH1-like n=1 Tax=Quercus lobata TaxID=97700 RepID=UPI001248D322|nr:transcription factor IBH1-like [Quercus lobata]
MNSKRFSPPSCTIKSRFTRRFLRAFLKINRQRTRTPSSPMEICQRYLKVKLAADVSMASAVGPRRAWSRAMLAKIRHGVRAGSTSSLTMRKRKIYHGKKSTKEVGIAGNAKMLRKLVPGGGEAMDTCSLLDETFHYIKCLSTQVKVMTRIADQICST